MPLDVRWQALGIFATATCSFRGVLDPPACVCRSQERCQGSVNSTGIFLSAQLENQTVVVDSCARVDVSSDVVRFSGRCWTAFAVLDTQEVTLAASSDARVYVAEGQVPFWHPGIAGRETITTSSVVNIVTTQDVTSDTLLSLAGPNLKLTSFDAGSFVSLSSNTSTFGALNAVASRRWPLAIVLEQPGADHAVGIFCPAGGSVSACPAGNETLPGVSNTSWTAPQAAYLASFGNNDLADGVLLRDAAGMLHELTANDMLLWFTAESSQQVEQSIEEKTWWITLLASLFAVLSVLIGLCAALKECLPTPKKKKKKKTKDDTVRPSSTQSMDPFLKVLASYPSMQATAALPKNIVTTLSTPNTQMQADQVPQQTFTTPQTTNAAPTQSAQTPVDLSAPPSIKYGTRVIILR